MISDNMISDRRLLLYNINVLVTMISTNVISDFEADLLYDINALVTIVSAKMTRDQCSLYNTCLSQTRYVSAYNVEPEQWHNL